MGTAVRCILASYPMWWKERYGAETADLTEDLLADDDARQLLVLLNLAMGSVLAWARYRRPDRGPRFAGTLWGPVPDGGHRDIFGNRGLTPGSLRDLEPEEAVLGVIDGWRGSPFLATYPPTMALVIAFSLFLDLVFPRREFRLDSVQLLMWSALLAVTLVGKLLTSSAAVTIAVTSNGLAIFRMGMFTRRTGSMVMRLPGAPPSVAPHRSVAVQGGLGGPKFWVASKSMPLIRWMSGHPGSRARTLATDLTRSVGRRADVHRADGAGGRRSELRLRPAPACRPASRGPPSRRRSAPCPRSGPRRPRPW